MIFVCKT